MPQSFNPPISCISTLLEIQGNDCIGDTREAINDNVRYLGTAICNLSSQRLVPSTSTTIQHFLNNSSRVLTFEIINNSVTTSKIALSAVTTDKIALSAVTADRINLVTSLSTNGYQIMPGGLIMQWGKIDSINFNQTNQGPYLFPVSFPNNCLNIVTTIIRGTGINGVWNANVNTVTLSSFRVFGDYDVGTGTAPIYWQALGH
jgi:hypothetical protein